MVGRVVTLALLLLLPHVVRADVLCRAKGGRLAVRAKCKAAERVFDLATLGVTGPTGPAGVDGSVKLFGDGSAGALDVSSTVDEFDTATDANFQFSSLRIRAGALLITRSGRVYRVNGSCLIEGGLFSANAPGTGGFATLNSTGQFVAYHTGVSGEGNAGASGVCVQNATFAAPGGVAARGLARAEAVNLTTAPISASAAGGGSVNSFPGGSGGGTVGLFCKDGITVTASGQIGVEGDDAQSSGGGGGSGGLLLLASSRSIVNDGTLFAPGGDGGPSSTNVGAGGGGSGGIIHLVAPAIVAGSTNVDGGAAGSDATAITAAIRCGGSGGGALGGDGGAGSSVPAGSSATGSGASAGGAGLVIATPADPTAILLR